MTWYVYHLMVCIGSIAMQGNRLSLYIESFALGKAKKLGMSFLSMSLMGTPLCCLSFHHLTVSFCYLSYI